MGGRVVFGALCVFPNCRFVLRHLYPSLHPGTSAVPGSASRPRTSLVRAFAPPPAVRLVGGWAADRAQRSVLALQAACFVRLIP